MLSYLALCHDVDFGNLFSTLFLMDSKSTLNSFVVIIEEGTFQLLIFLQYARIVLSISIAHFPRISQGRMLLFKSEGNLFTFFYFE